MNEHVLDEVMANFYRFLEENDDREVLTAMGGGQDTHPSGTIYCGTGPAWSTQNLRSVVRSFLDKAEKVAFIDWHTGLGEPGETMVLVDEFDDRQTAEWAARHWGVELPDEDQEGPAKPDFVGQVYAGVASDVATMGAKVVASVAEVGTVDNQSVLAALLIDRWLRFECDDLESPMAVEYRTRMLERLNPSRLEWRQAAQASMRRFHLQTIAGIRDI